MSWDNHTGLLGGVNPYEILDNDPQNALKKRHEKAQMRGCDYPRTLPCFPFLAAIKLVGNQALVPSHEGVRGDNNGGVFELFAAQKVGQLGKSAAFGVSNVQSTAREFRLEDFILFPPLRFLQRTVPRPWREETREALPSPILRGMSRPCSAALRLAARNGGGLLLCPGAFASTAREGRMPAKAGSRGAG